MKFLKQLIVTAVASCVLAAGAMAVEPQKDQKPPPKQPQEVRKPDKPPPPPPSNNNSNKGSNDGKRGKP